MMKKSYLHLVGGVLLCLTMIFSSCGNADNALEEIINGGGEGGGSSTTKTYLKWDDGTQALKATSFPETYKTMTATETTWSGTYIVEDNISINEDVTLGGDVDIVLCDGKTLTVKAKISGTYNLNIYAQSTDVATAGKLDVAPTGTSGANAINVKGLQIHGGTIEATGAKNTVTSGTGGYGITTTGKIIFYAGKVTATGGDSTDGFSDNGGRGISCGGNEITIYQAEVTATGGKASNGTGGWGIYCNGNPSDPQLTIKGGTVKATGGDGTGHGSYGVHCQTTVDSGKLYAQGGNNTNDSNDPSKGMYGPLYFDNTLTCSAGKSTDYTEAPILDHDATDGIDDITYQYVKVE